MAGALSYIHAVIPVNISGLVSRSTFPGLIARPTPFAPKSPTFAEITTSLKPKSIRRCMTLRTLPTNNNSLETSNISDKYKKGFY